MSDVRKIRDKASALSSEHAKLFDQGHEGSAHCQCEMAKEVRRLDEQWREMKKQQMGNRLDKVRREENEACAIAVHPEDFEEGSSEWCALMAAQAEIRKRVVMSQLGGGRTV